MADLADFDRNMDAPPAPSRDTPQGWTPGLTLDGDAGKLTSRPVPDGEAAPGWQDELRGRGGDPDRWMPSGPMRFSSWDAQVKGGDVVQMHAYRWNLVPVGGHSDPQLLELLSKRAGRRKPRKAAEVGGARTLVVKADDLQIGKTNLRTGAGTAELKALWDDKIGAVEDRLDELARLGRPASRILVAGGGDTTEGCANNYASQAFTVDLNEADQMQHAANMLEDAIDRWSGKVDELWSTTVSSNHDARRSGKDYPTGRADCRAFTIWRALARAYAKNPDRYGHVRFWIPEDPDVATVDLHGTGVAIIHGDLAGKGAGIREKMWNWWQGQTMGGLPAGDCSVLLTSHYHHFWSAHQSGKWIVGATAMDVAGSDWLTSGAGLWSSPALTTLVVDAGGVSDIALL